MIQGLQVEIDELLAQRKFQKALKKTKSLQKKMPKESEFVRLEGIVHLHQKQVSLAEKKFKKALTISPNNFSAKTNLAFVYYLNKKLLDAKSLYIESLSSMPNNIEANCQLGHVGVALNDWSLAEKQFKRTLSINPNHMESLVNLALLLKNNGEIEESIVYFKHALDINPFQADIYWTLANLKTYQFTSEEKAVVEQMIKQVSNPKEQSDLLFTKAKFLEDDGLYDLSFESLKVANFIKYQTFETKPQNWSAKLSAIKTVFTASFVEQCQTNKLSNIYPVLIAGMPRSGSTLIEQILASHSAITGASELDFLGDWVAQKTTQDKREYPESLVSSTVKEFEQLALQYKEDTAVWWKQTPCFTDKMPNNIRYAGAFLMAFPEAKVIHTQRNAMDVCLSAYKQNFEMGNQYSFDLKNLVAYYNFQDSLAKHWASLFPNRFITVSYESVIEDVESETRRLLTFLGFEYEKACHDFYKTKRSIRTASAGQVTQKIYKTATQYYKKYGDSIKELSELLEGENG